MDPPEVLLLLIGVLVYLLLLERQVSCSVLKLHLLLFDLLFQVTDLLVVLRHRLLQLHVTSTLLELNVGLEGLNTRLDRVESNFLDKDLFRVCNSWLGVRSLLRDHFGILDAEACKCTIDADTEQLAVVVVKAHSLDLLRVSLDLDSLFDCVVVVVL